MANRGAVTPSFDPDAFMAERSKQGEEKPNTVTDPIVGVLKGAVSTLFHSGDLIRRGEGAVKNALPKSMQDWLDSAPQGVKDFVGYGQRPLDNPDVQAATTPSNTAQKVGYYGEQMGEYMVPGMEAEKGASLAARAAMSGGKAALVRGAQTGGDPAQMLTAGAVGAAAPVAVAGVKGAVKIAGNMPEGAAGRALKLIPGYDTAKKWVATLDDIRQAVAEKSGTSAPPPIEVTPEVVHSVNPSNDFWQRYSEMMGALKASPEAAAEPATIEPAPAAPAPTPVEAQPSAASTPQPVRVPLKARRMAQTLLDDIRQSQAPQTVSEAPPEPAPAATPAPVSSSAPSVPATPGPEATPQPAPAATAEPPAKTNPYEEKARTEKANSLAQFLYLGGQGVKPEEAEFMNPDHWRMAAKAAGVKEPSLITVEDALTKLKKLWDMDAVAQELKASTEASPNQ